MSSNDTNLNVDVAVDISPVETPVQVNESMQVEPVVSEAVVSPVDSPVNSIAPAVFGQQVNSTAASPPKTLNVQAEQINEVINSIIDLLDGRKMKPEMIIRIVANCMRVTAKMNVSNSLKKKILVESIEKFITEKSGLDSSETQVVMTVVDTVVDEAVDTIADVSSGKLQLVPKGCCTIM